MSVIIPKHTKKSDLARFFHGACFSLSVTTFLQAVVNGNFQSWPGFTPELINEILKPSMATHFGHLNQERQILQTTKNTSSMEDDFFPPQDIPNLKTKDCCK